MDWFDFFTNEAISNYLVFILGIPLAIGGRLLVRWLNRKRPQTVKLIKVSESSLIEIDQKIKDSILIMYKKAEIDSLYLSQFILFNAGEEIIDNAEVTVEFYGADVLDVDIDDPIPERANSTSKVVESSVLQVILPYLNPNNPYKDVVAIKIFCLKPVRVRKFIGGGRGWNVRFFDRVRFQSELRDDLAALDPTDFIGIARIGWKYLMTFLNSYKQ